MTDQSSEANKESARVPHATSVKEVLNHYKVGLSTGLAATEAAERLKVLGANAIQTIRSRSGWRILVDQFTNIVVALLGTAAAVSWLTGDALEAVSILVVLLINAAVGFATEWQAGRALDSLRRQTTATALVRRDGREATIDAQSLVPGDIILVTAGDRVPADARLAEAAALRAEESALTGESTAVEKAADPVEPDAPLSERTSMLHLGTTVVGGHGIGIVTRTGSNTELGRIGRLVAEASDESTPLERRLATLGRRLVYLVLAIAAFVFLAGWLRGDDPWIMLKVAISLGVAAVPEGLPAVTTLILALGVLRMAREKAVVRRLPAVETLGSATVICTDKTGTLTENRMTVREYRLADGTQVRFTDDGANVAQNQLLSRIALAGALCNEASLAEKASGKKGVIGDPTETALLLAAQQLKIEVRDERERFPKRHEEPFDPGTKRMITVHQSPKDEMLAFMKGAPAVVLDACTSYAAGPSEIRPLDDSGRDRFLGENNEMADDALRVLGLAEKKIATTSVSRDALREGIESDFTFLGLVGLIDPPRPEVPEAIKRAIAAGIRIVMLTGDQLNTARAIARELHLASDGNLKAVHARDLPDSNDGALSEIVKNVHVFARVSPEDKLRIVEALREANEVVAVTGDGVNDAPALKRADIGIAMGQRGTEVAKEASDIVLADDNFATIIKAVEGGRTIYANITRFVHFMFSNNLAEVLVIFSAILLGWPLPLLPLQILWINLVTDVFPALALALEPPSSGVMHRRPRPPTSALLSRPFMILIGWQGALLALITLGAYWWALEVYGEGAHARTVALLVLIGVQIGHLFNCRSRIHSAFEGLFRNPYIWLAVAIVIILQLLAVYATPISRALGTVPPNRTDWLLAALAIAVPIVVVEIAKKIARRRADIV